MNLIKPSYSILTQELGLEGIYKICEIAGRNCYKSEPKEGISSKDFVDKMINRGHLGVLEHGTIYLKSSYDVSAVGSWNHSIARRYSENKYSIVNYDNHMDLKGIYVTTNLRVLQENNWLDDLKYLCEPTEYHEKRVTVKFTSNIHFYKDITRHRRFSFCIESTRYCNYCKSIFGSQLTFIIPSWTNIEEGEVEHIRDGSSIWDGMAFGNYDPITRAYKRCKDFYSEQEMQFLYSLKIAENMYYNLTLANDWKPEQSAEILPQATKADIIMTGFVSDWSHVFDLRTSYIAKTGKPHPEVFRLMDPLYNEFKEKGLIYDS